MRAIEQKKQHAPFYVTVTSNSIRISSSDLGLKVYIIGLKDFLNKWSVYVMDENYFRLILRFLRMFAQT